MLLVAINAGGSYTEKNPDTCQFPDLNMCNYIQCSNNGTCQKSNNSDCFTCTCPPGFSGKMCFDIVPETEPDCSSSPCLNGATCLMTALKTFFCLCPNEFYGLRCEARIERPNTTDVCSPNPCSNNGQCIDLGGRTACICPQYATGQYCEQNTTQDSLCEAFQPFCQNGGSCVAGNDTVYCACPPGYSGPFCNTKINLSDPCSSSPCLNGGICYNYRGQAMCLCSMRTSGRYCEYGSYDPCDSAPCMNNGTCISQNQTFACRCPQGTTGDQCETRIQLTCEDKPCHNGGTCYQNADSFICMCRSQYEGEQCDVMNIAAQCPLDCFPGDCIRTDVPQYPYACSCQGTIRLDSCEGI